jgi:hypothetical protein
MQVDLLEGDDRLASPVEDHRDMIDLDVPRHGALVSAQLSTFRLFSS